MMHKIYCYYLLYKHKNSDIQWIVTKSDNYYELFSEIKYFSSNVETYYIVSRKLDPNTFSLYCKQFTVFDTENIPYNILFTS